jgi:uncharacterized protein (TIGR03086 family)
MRMPTNIERAEPGPGSDRVDVDLVALDAEAVRATIDLVAGATNSDMTRPTPCIGWTLYGLLAHMATQHHGFAAASRGEGELAAWKLRSLGSDPVGAYRAAAEHVLDAFAADGVLDRGFPLPEFRAADQPFPAPQAISFHLVDYVVHAWDVARTLDATLELSPEVVDAAYDVAQIVPTGAARLTPGAAFGPDVPWSGGSRMDQIVAHLGRSPNWPH